VRILVVSNLFPPLVLGGYEVACGGVVDSLMHHHDVMVLTSDWHVSDAPIQPHVRRELPYVLGHRRDVPKAPTYARRAARTTRAALSAHRPDLIFIWNGTRIPQTALRVAHTYGVPVVFSVMEHWFARLYSVDYFTRVLSAPRRTRGLWPALLTAANAIDPSLRISLSPPLPCSVIWNAHIMRELNSPPRSVTVTRETVIPVGTPHDILYSQLPRSPVSPPMALFAGRVVHEKGPDLLLDALAFARKGDHPFTVTFAGPVDPPYASALRARAQALGLDMDAVTLTGPLDAAALGRLFSQASAVVIPSRWQEPAPLIAVEAAFARVPIVASRSGGMPAQFAEGREALFFDIDDGAGLGAALSDLLTNPRATDGRVLCARGRAEEYRFSDYATHVERFVVECAQAG